MKHHPVAATRAIVHEVDCEVELTASKLNCEETEDVITIIHRSVEIAETTDLVNQVIVIFNMFFPT